MKPAVCGGYSLHLFHQPLPLLRELVVILQAVADGGQCVQIGSGVSSLYSGKQVYSQFFFVNGGGLN